MRPQLTEISLSGFKTIRKLDNFPLGRLTVLIGPNGAGKSNFISFFQMIPWVSIPPHKFQEYVARQGGASKLLLDGPAKTRDVKTYMKLKAEAVEYGYGFRLSYAADDTFIFADEIYGPQIENASWRNADAGKREAQFLSASAQVDITRQVIANLLRRMTVYQFHDTSETARVRQKWDLNDSIHLKSDAGNLAPVLYRLQSEKLKHFHRIVKTIRQVLPFFDDFELEPDEFGSILLRWRERGSDLVFSASQAADGMLRLISLTTLLLLPEDELPDVLILDEPELGLHPSAINMVGGLMRSISTKIQVIIATQSVSLVDCFEPEDIVVVERGGRGASEPGTERETSFVRLDPDRLEEWLEEYSLSELWEKNVLGGRP